MPQLQWRKSSYSGQSGSCVEVAPVETTAVAVRDSKNPSGPAFTVAPAAWSRFIKSIRS